MNNVKGVWLRHWEQYLYCWSRLPPPQQLNLKYLTCSKNSERKQVLVGFLLRNNNYKMTKFHQPGVWERVKGTQFLFSPVLLLNILFCPVLHQIHKLWIWQHQCWFARILLSVTLSLIKHTYTISLKTYQQVGKICPVSNQNLQPISFATSFLETEKSVLKSIENFCSAVLYFSVLSSKQKWRDCRSYALVLFSVGHPNVLLGN